MLVVAPAAAVAMPSTLSYWMAGSHDVVKGQWSIESGVIKRDLQQVSARAMGKCVGLTYEGALAAMLTGTHAHHLRHPAVLAPRVCTEMHSGGCGMGMEWGDLGDSAASCSMHEGGKGGAGFMGCCRPVGSESRVGGHSTAAHWRQGWQAPAPAPCGIWVWAMGRGDE